MDDTSSEKSTIPCVRDRNSGGMGGHGEVRYDQRRRAAGSVGGLPSGRPPVLHQGVQRAVTGQPAGGENGRLGETPGEEPVGDGREHRPVTGQVQQGRGRRPAGGRDQQVAVDALAGAQRHPADTAIGAPPATLGPHDVTAGSGIDHTDDVDPGAAEILHGGITFGVGGEDDGPLAGPHGPEVDEAAHGGREQHPGFVVAGEHVRDARSARAPPRAPGLGP